MLWRKLAKNFRAFSRAAAIVQRPYSVLGHGTQGACGV